MNDVTISAARRFSCIVAPHLRDAYTLARRLTGSSADAQDVVQEASIRALRGSHGFAGGSARAWVLTIVRNSAYDWLRKNRPVTLVFVDDLEEVERAQLAQPDPAGLDSASADQEDSTLLATAILGLPAHYREPLLLRVAQGLSYREVAERSEVSIGTVMSRLFRARRQLVALVAQQRHSSTLENDFRGAV